MRLIHAVLVKKASKAIKIDGTAPAAHHLHIALLSPGFECLGKAKLDRSCCQFQGRSDCWPGPDRRSGAGRCGLRYALDTVDGSRSNMPLP